MSVEKKINYDVQGGIRNYLGKQKTVSDVPLKWKSGPGHPETELAYITKAEKNLLIKKDLHKSLKDGPNKGPAGIMSLNNDGIGDLGGPGNVSAGGGYGDTGDLGSETANDASLSAGNQTVGYGGPDGDPRTGGGVTTESPFQQALNFYNKLPTPLNIVKKVLTKVGPFNNEDFYNEKVVPAGKTNLSYDKYMSARMAGTIDAYGNPTGTGQGGNNASSGGDDGIMTVYNNTNYTDDGDADGDGDVDQTDNFIFKYFDKTGESLQAGAGGVEDLMTRIRQRIDNILTT